VHPVPIPTAGETVVFLPEPARRAASPKAWLREGGFPGVICATQPLGVRAIPVISVLDSTFRVGVRHAREGAPATSSCCFSST
jgi:hypothetical protein